MTEFSLLDKYILKLVAEHGSKDFGIIKKELERLTGISLEKLDTDRLENRYRILKHKIQIPSSKDEEDEGDEEIVLHDRKVLHKMEPEESWSLLGVPKRFRKENLEDADPYRRARAVRNTLNADQWCKGDTSSDEDEPGPAQPEWTVYKPLQSRQPPPPTAPIIDQPQDQPELPSPTRQAMIELCEEKRRTINFTLPSRIYFFCR